MSNAPDEVLLTLTGKKSLKWFHTVQFLTNIVLLPPGGGITNLSLYTTCNFHSLFSLHFKHTLDLACKYRAMVYLRDSPVFVLAPTMSLPLPLSGVRQSITIQMKYRMERGHSEVNIRYTIRMIHATPERVHMLRAQEI